MLQTSPWHEYQFMVCVLSLTEYEWMKSLRGRNKETVECLEMGLDWWAGNIVDFNVNHWWGTIGVWGRIALPLRKFILAAKGRTRWRRGGCTQRDLRGDGYGNSSGGRLGWTRMIWVSMETAQRCIQVVVRQDLLVEWILLEQRDRRERKR